MDLTVVIPVYNEAPSLPRLLEELNAAVSALGLRHEVMLVDDGSTDDSWAVIAKLAAAHPNTVGVRLRRNFGKAAALDAGFRLAQGELVLTLDGDRQDDPAELGALHAEMQRGFDVVSGWKKVRHDPWHKVIPSRIFNWMISFWTGVRLHDHNCGMKLYRREVVREIRLYGELHRFVPVLAAARGFRVSEVPVRHRPREHGRSKYGVERFLRGFLDLLTVSFLTRYNQRPLHLLGFAGLLSLGLGLAAMVYLAVIWLLRLGHPADYEPLHQRPLLIYAVAAVIVGVQLVSVGFLAELLTSYHQRQEPGYAVKATVGPVPRLPDVPTDGPQPERFRGSAP